MEGSLGDVPMTDEKLAIHELGFQMPLSTQGTWWNETLKMCRMAIPAELRCISPLRRTRMFRNEFLYQGRYL